ncbi:mucin-2-like [Ptychodera flava]|uniref:mucin-2-like n=1 Tax=Ptychodera flava TaxID=63121 RepID=UPI003969ED6A
MPPNTMTASMMTDVPMPTQAPTKLAVTEAIQTATKIAPTKSMTFVMDTDTKDQIPTASLTRKMPPNTMTAGMMTDAPMPTQAPTKLAVTEAIQTATKIAPAKSMTFMMDTDTKDQIPTASMTRKMPPNTMTAGMMADVAMPTQAPTKLAVTEAIQTATKIAPTKSMTYSMKATETWVKIPTAPLTRKMPPNTMTASMMADVPVPTQAPTNLAVTEAIKTATKIAPAKSMTFVMDTDTKDQIPTASLTRKMPPNTMTASMMTDVPMPTQAPTKLAVTEAIQTATKIAPAKSMTFVMETDIKVQIPTAPLTRKMPPNTMTAGMMTDAPMPTQAPTKLAVTEAIQTATKIAPTKSMTFVMETDTKTQIPTALLTRKMPPNTMTAGMMTDAPMPTQAPTKLAVTEAIQTATKIAPTKSMTFVMETDTKTQIPTAPLTRKMPPSTMTAGMMVDVAMPTQAPTKLAVTEAIQTATKMAPTKSMTYSMKATDTKVQVATASLTRKIPPKTMTASMMTDVLMATQAPTKPVNSAEGLSHTFAQQMPLETESLTAVPTLLSSLETGGIQYIPVL